MSKSGAVPMRMCIGCRQMKPRKDLLRLMRTADGRIVADTSGHSGGRGAYICRSGECLESAGRHHAFKRALGVDMNEESLISLREEIDR